MLSSNISNLSKQQPKGYMAQYAEGKDEFWKNRQEAFTKRKKGTEDDRSSTRSNEDEITLLDTKTHPEFSCLYFCCFYIGMILSPCENDPVHYCAPNLLFAEFDILLLSYLKLYLTVIFDFHLFSSVLRMKFRFSSNYVYYFRLSLSCDDLNRDCCYPPTHLSIYVPTHLLTILFPFVAPPHDPITHDTGS